MKKYLTGLLIIITIFSLTSSATAASSTATKSKAPTKIAKATKVPVIDGKLDDAWSKATVFQAKKVGLMKDKSLKKPDNSSDLSLTWRAMWDKNNLYFYAEVTDDIKVTDYEQPQGDAVEVYVDADNSKEKWWWKNDSLLWLAYDESKILGWTRHRADGTDWKLPNGKGATFKQKNTKTGYVIELSIPWANLLAEDIKEGKKIGFDVMVNDHDNGKKRESRLCWYTTNEDAWQYVSTLGTIELSPAPAKK